MTETDRREFFQIMIKLADVYGANLTEELGETYFEAMKTFSIDTLNRACQTAVQECQWFPKPVELRSFASQPERVAPMERDGVQLFRCSVCSDMGFVLGEHLDDQGRNLGRFSKPCSCPMGEALRARWESTDSKGHVFADSARDVTAILKRGKATPKPLTAPTRT